jgi:hypothetical protein
MPSKPKTKPLFGPRGLAFYDYALADFDLSKAESEILMEACRTLDDLEALAKAIERDGITVTGSTGQTRAHPALAEMRNHRLALGRLLGLLELPDEAGEQLPSYRQAQARSAGRLGAQKRWGTNG